MVLTSMESAKMVFGSRARVQDSGCDRSFFLAQSLLLAQDVDTIWVKGKAFNTEGQNVVEPSCSLTKSESFSE